MENKKIGVLTFEAYHGRRNIGSSKIRGHWLVKHWPNAELFIQGQKYDAVIYEKAYWFEHAEVFDGVKILDLCDPDFLHWTYDTSRMIDEVDAITTSSEGLAKTIRKFTDKPVICIPDRVDLTEFRGRKFHTGQAKWVVWFGYSHNFEMLKPVLHFLKKYKLNLIVISDVEFNLPMSFSDSIELKNFIWDEKTAHQDIMCGDIVINPSSIKGKWKFKSDNKTIISWALGMPVAKTIAELEKFIDEKTRQEESKKRLEEIKEKWDIKISIKEFEELIEQIYEKRKKDS